MPSLIFVFLLSLSSSPFTFTSAADPKYLYHECSYTIFTKNSTYQTNLHSLLSSLPSNANRSNGFYKATSGQDPTKVYGLFQCLGDITTTTCQVCVAFASKEVTRRCPDKKEAIIWYDECLLHYSDASIVYTSGFNNGPLMLNDTKVTIEPGRFHLLMLRLMYGAATQAANDPKKFATREGNSTTSQPIYGLVQCTEDLSNTDCSRCLQEAIANLPAGRVGGRVLLPNCYCRYESYLFYNENLIASLPPPPSRTRPKGKSQFSSSIIVAIIAAIAFSAVLSFAGYCFLTRRARKKYNALKHEEVAGIGITTVGSLQFDFGTIQAATNRFSTDNKLGAGGFGEVYKGVLPNGQEIAVKRLSKSSVQGTKEFQNEVLLVAKLQHKNLVRLQGYCLEGEERILVYEFVPNKSLDYILFDPEKQGQLDLSRKYKIIQGIARGLLYLHQDSQLRVIHRDLKTSNILLDEDMNPKISDFGMAKIFGVDQIQGNTGRIMGTYGYMSPEYAMHGKFSVKSDVYSFGVLVLEIITGKKNSSFCDPDGAKDLLSYAWKHWRDGTTMQLLDSNLTDSYSRNEVHRFIHVGLLCVLEDPAARPTMATVVLMLNSYSVTLPLPGKPAFFQGSNSGQNMQITNWMDSDKSISKSIPWSVDDASITEVYPR